MRRWVLRSASLVSGLCAACCGGRSGLFGEPVVDETPAPPPSAAPTPTASAPRPPPAPPPAPPKPKPDPDPKPAKPCAPGMCPDDGDACNGVESCDAKTNTCVHSAPPSCDDGLVCNGLETCDPARGCVAGDAVTCDAPGASCDENTGRCACDAGFLPPDCRVKTTLFAPFGQVEALAEEHGVLWVTTSTGLWGLDFAGTPAEPKDDRWAYFNELVGASDSGKLVVDQLGTKWFTGSYDRQVVRFDDGGTPLVPDDDTWDFYRYSTDSWPSSIAVDATGTVWLGRSGETLTFSDTGTPEDRSDDVWRTVSALGAPATLANLASVDVILSEPEGVVWLASSAGELFAYDTEHQQFFELTGAGWSRIDALAWQGGTLYVALASGDSNGPLLGAIPVRGSLAAVSAADAELYAAPHAIETFDVDSGGRVWASDLGSSFSCLELASRSWSEWNLGTSVSSVLARSATDLWLGADRVLYVNHGGSCLESAAGTTDLAPADTLRSDARDVAIEGKGVWVAADSGVDYLDTAGTALDRADDRWAHFGEDQVSGLADLQGALVGPDGTKYFWGKNRVFALDDRGTPLDTGDDVWVSHTTDALWVAGVVDANGRLLVVANTNQEPTGTARIVVFDPGGTPDDPSDDVVTTIDSGQPGIGRNMTLDTEGQLWVGTETDTGGGNLFHWDRRGTPLDGKDDVWTPMRTVDGRVWKLEADPTGGIWGTVAEGVFQFYDGGTPTELADDYWHLYPELGSAMDIGPGGVGWFRMPGGVGILDVGGTPRDPRDDASSVLLAPDALRFQSNLYTNGVIDDEGHFWVASGYLQVFQAFDTHD